MLKSSGAMAGATLTSRVLGMVREICYARFMGDGVVAGAFMLAFMIPNLFRRLLGEGALTAAFIPLFKTKEKTEGEAAAWRAANAVLSALVVAAAVLAGVVLLGVSLALYWGEWGGKTALMLELLRWMFPYMLLICLTAVFMGMLNARGHFFVPALGACLMNVVMIVAVLVFAPRLSGGLEGQVFALAVGVLVAGVAQLGFQLPWLRREGFRWRWVSPWRDGTVREVAAKMVPGAVGVAAFQINMVVTQGMGFWVGDHVVASYTYAVRLMEVPQGVFGASLAAFLLPALAGLAAEKKGGEFKATLREGLGHLVFVHVLMTVLLMTLAEPIVRLLFESGKFGADATRRAAFALVCLAPGLLAFSSVHIFARAFYSMGDVKTPMKLSLVCLGLNVAVALALVFRFPEGREQGALGIANAVSSTVNVGLLVWWLRQRVGGLGLWAWAGRLWGVLPAAIAAAAVAWGLSGRFGNADLGAQLAAVFVPMVAAGGVYFVVTWLAAVPSARELGRWLGGRQD